MNEILPTMVLLQQTCIVAFIYRESFPPSPQPLCQNLMPPFFLHGNFSRSATGVVSRSCSTLLSELQYTRFRLHNIFVWDDSHYVKLGDNVKLWHCCHSLTAPPRNFSSISPFSVTTFTVVCRRELSPFVDQCCSTCCTHASLCVRLSWAVPDVASVVVHYGLLWDKATKWWVGCLFSVPMPYIIRSSYYQAHIMKSDPSMYLKVCFPAGILFISPVVITAIHHDTFATLLTS